MGFGGEARSLKNCSQAKPTYPISLGGFALSLSSLKQLGSSSVTGSQVRKIFHSRDTEWTNHRLILFSCTDGISAMVVLCLRTCFLQKKQFALNQPTTRPKQIYKDFSSAASTFENEAAKGKVFGKKAWFGDEGLEYVAFIGLRADEQLRVARVETRSSNPHANVGYEGEQVYMPLATMHINKENVNAFWEQQSWKLNLHQNGALSNCVYCFLKGVGSLTQAYSAMESQKEVSIEGFGSIINTPCDIDWWIRKEQEYGRDLELEKRERTNPNASSFIGFFGATSNLSYETIADCGKNGVNLEFLADTVLPCDCTE